MWLWDVEQGKALRKFRGHQAKARVEGYARIGLVLGFVLRGDSVLR